MFKLPGTSIFAALIIFLGSVFSGSVSFVQADDAQPLINQPDLSAGLDIQLKDSATGPHIKVSLISEHAILQVGHVFWLGLLLEPEHGWHTYWHNSGDSGEPPTIKLTLPEGITSGEILWPMPAAIEVAHLVNYGYADATLLMLPINIPAAFQLSQLPIEASVSWLVCQEDCIPGWATLRLNLPLVHSQLNEFKTKAPSHAGEYATLFTETRAKLPEKTLVFAEHEVTDKHLVIRFRPPYESRWRLFPYRSDLIQHNQAQKPLLQSDQAVYTLNLSDYYQPDTYPPGHQQTKEADLQFLLSDGAKAYPLVSKLNQASASMVSETQASPGLTAIVTLAFLAFVGGVILNLMPCVLPVLSIKALSMQQSMQQQTKDFATQVGYLLGVLASFNFFALLIILLQQSGEALGWGFHMQQPWVVALLAYLFVLLAMLLLDVTPMTGRMAGIGQNLISGNEFASQFFTGVLAVLVASPCTAPFMAAALGVAMVSSAGLSILLFTCLALGFALPLSLLFWFPAWQRWLPKPGPWMNTFKQWLAFPMLATMLWLVWIYLQQTNATAQLVLLSGLLLFAMSLWGITRAQNLLKWGIFILMVTSLLLPLLFSNPIPTASQQPESNKKALTYSAQLLQQLRDQEQIVLVNMTADWCITCKVNEQVAFSDSQVRALFEQPDVNYMVGDWTNKNSEILNFLKQYQRVGVPLYVLYTGHHHQKVLPQLLTPAILIDAIQQAQQEKTDEI